MDPHHQTVHDASIGQPGALETLLERHLPELHAFVRLRMGRLLQARESVSDLVQSACREVLQDLPTYRYRGEAAFKQWLYTAALRKIVDRHRYHRAQRRDAARDVDLRRRTDASCTETLGAVLRDLRTPTKVAAGREDLERLERCFRKLPEQYQEVILASRLIGLSHAEIAQELDKSEGAVRVLLSRALARLAEELARSGE